jgi:multicomponent Na+:H+ antiporter subunit C
MVADLAIIVGALFFVAVYLILGKTKREMVLGVVVLSNGVNLLLLSVSGSPQGLDTPIIQQIDAPSVDPVPQALILTAIVIGFGMLSLLIALVYKTDQRGKND